MKSSELRFSKKALISLFCFIIVFVVVMIVTYWTMGSVPDVLIQYTLGAGGIETSVLGAIKVIELFTNRKKSDAEMEDLDEGIDS